LQPEHSGNASGCTPSQASFLVAFGALTFWDAPRIQANLPTPRVGLWERINISVFLLWVVVLATVLLRADRAGQDRQERCDGRREVKME
jgi:hypothetical protein